MLKTLFEETLGGTPSLQSMWADVYGGSGLQNSLGGQPENMTGIHSEVGPRVQGPGA